MRIDGVGRVDFVFGDCLIFEVDGDENYGLLMCRYIDCICDVVVLCFGYEILWFDYV